jgi:hypothetical protein
MWNASPAQKNSRGHDVTVPAQNMNPELFKKKLMVQYPGPTSLLADLPKANSPKPIQANMAANPRKDSDKNGKVIMVQIWRPFVQHILCHFFNRQSAMKYHKHMGAATPLSKIQPKDGFPFPEKRSIAVLPFDTLIREGGPPLLMFYSIFESTQSDFLYGG